MSALSDLSAALLPPEAGGPDPHRVARPRGSSWTACRLASGSALESASRRSRLRPSPPRASGSVRLPSRSSRPFVKRIATSGPLGSAAMDALKTLVLMGAGGDEFAPEIRSVGSLHPPSRPDPPLNIRHADDVADGESFDVIVIGSGAGGAFAALELARAGLDVLIVEEGERWTSGRIRSTHPLERFASLYRDAGRRSLWASRRSPCRPDARSAAPPSSTRARATGRPSPVVERVARGGARARGRRLRGAPGGGRGDDRSRARADGGHGQKRRARPGRRGCAGLGAWPA